MSDMLDLDILAPEPKKIKIKGRIIDCYPPTIRQLLNIQKVVDSIQSQTTSADEALDKLEDALAAIIPALKTDTDIDLTIPQFYALINFLQTDAIPETASQAQAYPVQKKTASPEPSPTSSTTTPDTE